MDTTKEDLILEVKKRFFELAVWFVIFTNTPETINELLVLVQKRFLSTSQWTCWEERLHNDLFCVELDQKPQLNQ